MPCSCVACVTLQNPSDSDQRSKGIKPDDAARRKRTGRARVLVRSVKPKKRQPSCCLALSGSRITDCGVHLTSDMPVPGWCLSALYQQLELIDWPGTPQAEAIASQPCRCLLPMRGFPILCTVPRYLAWKRSKLQTIQWVCHSTHLIGVSSASPNYIQYFGTHPLTMPIKTLTGITGHLFRLSSQRHSSRPKA